MLRKIDKYLQGNKKQDLNKDLSAPHVYFMFDYMNEDIKERIFKIKKCEQENIDWASTVIFNQILKHVKCDGDIARIAIVPIPSRSFYKREKNSDHMFLIAKNIKQKILNANNSKIRGYIVDCLIPLSLGEQKKLSKENREKRTNNMFTIDPLIKIYINRNKYTHLWILDDVITTGSTLMSASKIIAEQINFENMYIVGIAH